MSSVLTACIVGGGNRACEHAEVLRSFPNIKLDGVFDPSFKAARHWLGNLRVPFYNDLELMLRRVRPAFALVTGPHDTHLEAVQQLADAGVPIMKEKPLARNLKEARQVLACAERVKFLVTVQRRFSRILGLVPQQLERIGAPRKFSFEYTLGTQEPANGWRGSKERAGGGCIIDMGYHLIDVALWYFGQPNSVMADFKLADGHEVENEARISTRYQSGLSGEIFVSRSAGPKRERLFIEGENGCIEVGRHSITCTAGGAVVFRHEDKSDWASILGRQFLSFLGHLNNFEEPNVVPASRHLEHVAFVEACYRSQKSGVYEDPSALSV